MKKEKPKYSHKIRQKRLSKATYRLFDLFSDNLRFLILIGLLTVIAFFIQDYPSYAKWFGFAIASYGVIANDSIQTLGVFITSNAHRTAWWILWIFIGLLFFIAVGISFVIYEGDVSYQRLQTEGLASYPSTITFWHLLAAIVLLLLTRMGIPVSTTFLLLSTFVTNVHVIEKMIIKSLLSYLVAFGTALGFWYMLLYFRGPWQSQKPNQNWFAIQWLSSGLLWIGWLMQDGANMAIFLPRHLSLLTFVGFVLFVWVLLGVLFYRHGGDMQRVVNTKTGITDIRAASSVSVFYMLLLFFFTFWSQIPMSTTWMFIGLLGGRELATGFWLTNSTKKNQKRFYKSLSIIFRDLGHVLVGLVVSIGLSCLVNPVIQDALKAYWVA